MRVFLSGAADLLRTADGLRVVRKFNRVGETLLRYEVYNHDGSTAS